MMGQESGNSGLSRLGSNDGVSGDGSEGSREDIFIGCIAREDRKSCSIRS